VSMDNCINILPLVVDVSVQVKLDARSDISKHFASF
jgi:hypothetical protein